ncbi:hypothetical protein HDF19_04680 [Mucilaginibacter sp. E4BP6]|uniref:hypothetical protein n=1 Tax=Mucilaginibacter sp. E4BP6 TaxID=2723089 RepID=UPI0015CCC5BF|nr:hypothetical protein [Mucilaginibacter sp. E4BP6]NYE64772.1 hypothetical protein [Mucilaginibacter sp. E4BP6]
MENQLLTAVSTSVSNTDNDQLKNPGCNFNFVLEAIQKKTKASLKLNLMKKLLLAITVCTLMASCTKTNYDKIYPVGTKFNYAAGPLSDLVQSGKTPENPFSIDSISPNSYGSAMGYYVSSANGIHYTMSDIDIKPVN